ncbi:DUF4846 domain-containing protein [Haliscomenobacter hydrossis]|uniref:DUF4846 domain-containing protein n=1 Tax=Haliscomenobacter hydrossis (strain ATCC 27775 / DSM 1100 / LMG 10767 / O) TaxID=760192 RepID=F4KWY6_HALH1|nr:DUF4846 domain-containing protein [Haliscomenobacter hydrossis]AEE53586.1 hypothetical protein Halhy_5763 [Haliscomenobacter hydrossis DSM 1100]
MTQKHLFLPIMLLCLGIQHLAFGQNPGNYINASGTSIATRIKLPKNYERIPATEGTFGAYLRKLPLKPDQSGVNLYDGRAKSANVHVAVLSIDVGTRDLQQCADAVMRLRAEYLFSQGRFQDIHFNFTNGFRCDYSKWREGYRMKVVGNKTSWYKKEPASAGYRSFRSYLDLVYTYAGTLSLEKELKPVKFTEMVLGDVLIRGGSPGHAVIVVDMAQNKSTGDKIFLLAQSYMPAQDIHILQNPNDAKLSPWYSINSPGDEVITPEWDFKKLQLRRF